jgi:hypothetical protein
MQTEVGTEQSNGKLITWQPESASELRLWLVDKITQLSECFGESLTDARLRAYAESLADLSREQLRLALNRALNELKFFPKIAELRELSGAPKPEQREEVEAKAAFALVVRHLEREGVMAGMKLLPPRVQFAVRQCGGLELFNRRLQIHYGDDLNPGKVEDRSYVYLVRDFDEAYKSFPLHNEMQPQLTAKGLVALPEPVRLFLNPEPKPEKTNVEAPAPIPLPQFGKKMRAEPTDAELRDRREMLRQQAAQFRNRGTASPKIKVGNPLQQTSAPVNVDT